MRLPIICRTASAALLLALSPAISGDTEERFILRSLKPISFQLTVVGSTAGGDVRAAENALARKLAAAGISLMPRGQARRDAYGGRLSVDAELLNWDSGCSYFATINMSEWVKPLRRVEGADLIRARTWYGPKAFERATTRDHRECLRRALRAADSLVSDFIEEYAAARSMPREVDRDDETP